MDTKNSDDSAGSDSLDKSLQKKCVVDDVGQGEGASQEPSGSGCKNGEKVPAEHESQETPENFIKKQKTERSSGDSGGGGGGGGGSSSAEGASLSTEARAASTKAHDTRSATETNSAEELTNKTAQAAAVTSSCNSTASSTATPTNTTTTTTKSNNAFETKVKQISKNLKETTLAETANKKTSLEDSTSSSSSSSSSSECEQQQQTVANSSSSSSSASQAVAASELHDSSLLSANDSIDEHDHRSKKVRFHPDVKENDGGNRVIPKKKKKLKGTSSGNGGSGEGDALYSGQRSAGGTDDEMDLDEEEDMVQEEEEEFDLAKTIAEAQDYLKLHPLTFVRPHDKSGGRLKNGLLEEEDLPQLSESSEEEDFYEQVSPENGVERILGKQIKGGKVEFLLRYADRPGLFWETEDFIWKQCPNLLTKYEQNRERRQERLMRHVAKRQNIRQRYTDF